MSTEQDYHSLLVNSAHNIQVTLKEDAIINSIRYHAGSVISIQDPKIIEEGYKKAKTESIRNEITQQSGRDQESINAVYFDLLSLLAVVVCKMQNSEKLTEGEKAAIKALNSFEPLYRKRKLSEVEIVNKVNDFTTKTSKVFG